MRKIFFVLLIILMFVFIGCKNTINTYTVTFYDKENNEVLVVTIEEGENATAPILEEVEGYEFIGWDTDYTKVMTDLNIKPLYSNITFKVSFKDYNGQELSAQEVAYGSFATAPANPSRKDYTFIGWDREFSNITTDTIITALYEESTFYITFIDWDNAEIEIKPVNKGEKAECSIEPKRDGYTFIGWDKDISDVTSSFSVKAIYEINKYTITYYDNNKKINLEPKEYTIEDLVFLPEYEKDDYDFLGWYESISSTTKIVSLNYGETGNKVFYAKWQKIEEEVKLTLPTDGKFLFNNIKKIPHSTVPNLMVYQPDFTGLSVPTTSVTAWTWESLDTSIITVSTYSSLSIVSSGFAIIKATLKSDSTYIGYAVVKTSADGIFISSIEEANTKVSFEVKFTDELGNVINVQNVSKGGTAILPTPPEKTGYTFIGWDELHYNIQKNIIIKAKYIPGDYSYIGKKVSILGDSISTFKGFIPDGYSYFYPYPTADIADVNQTWWMQVVNTLGMELLKNNSWSGSCVSSGTGVSAAVNDDRLKELINGSIKPDVIIIFMGANDCGSKYVSINQFTSSYKIMIDKIKLLCPNTELFLCTLPSSKMYSSTDKDTYNDVIKKYASDYSLTVLDLDSSYSQANCESYIIDSIHPNKAGMNIFAATIVHDMLKSHDVSYTK